MKVTALLPNDLVAEVRQLARGKTLTESLIIALREWRSIQRLRVIRDRIKTGPSRFATDFRHTVPGKRIDREGACRHIDLDRGAGNRGIRVDARQNIAASAADGKTIPITERLIYRIRLESARIFPGIRMFPRYPGRREKASPVSA